MVGKNVYVLFTEIIEDGCIVRQTVESYANHEDACVDLKMHALTETERLANEHPDWKMAKGSEDYFECCKEDDIHNNHSTGKIVMNTIK